MKATDVLKSWKTLSEFVYGKVAGTNTEEVSDEIWEKLNKESLSLIKDTGIDEIAIISKKLNNLNILYKNGSFKIFEKIPNIWKAMFNTCVDVVAVEAGQPVMARRIG